MLDDLINDLINQGLTELELEAILDNYEAIVNRLLTA